MNEESFVHTVMAVVALLAIAAVSAVITKRIRFPYTVGLVLVGVCVAFIAEDYSRVGEAMEKLKLGPVMIMFLFIPILIFESAFNMDVPLLMRNLIASMTLAGPGLIISTAIISFLIYVLTPLPFESALIFGCLISATDPVAVIALLKDLGAPKRLNMLMEGESVFNDATAIVIFQITLAVIATGVLDFYTLTEGVVAFFKVFVGGLLVGILFGWILVRAIPLIGDQPLVHITMTLVSAYGAFIVADHFLHFSGIMAVLAAGLMIGYYGPVLYKEKVRKYLEVFWEDAAFVANSLIFLMLGFSEQVFLSHAQNNLPGLLYPVLIAIPVVLFARFVAVYSTVPVINCLPGAKPISRQYQTVLAWGGLRGAVAIALAMSLPKHFPYRWQIIDLTFGVTLFTLLVNGTTIRLFLRWFKLDRPSLLVNFMSTCTEIKAKKAAIARISRYQFAGDSDEALIERVMHEYQIDVDKAELQLESLRKKLSGNRKKRHKLMWIHAFSIQRQVYQHRQDNGLLSPISSLALQRDLKNKNIVVDRKSGPVVDAQTLPSERTQWFTFIGLAAQLLPGSRFAKRWQKKYANQLYEETAALYVASQVVQNQINDITEFSGADPIDASHCLVYYQNLEKMTKARLQLIDQSAVTFGQETLGLEEEVLHRIALDAEKSVLCKHVSNGELPEDRAELLECQFESRHQ